MFRGSPHRQFSFELTDSVQSPGKHWDPSSKHGQESKLQMSTTGREAAMCYVLLSATHNG